MFFNENDVRLGFDADEFSPSFQPIVELRTGQLVGFEILARWRHGKLGSIAPDNFIPVIEKCGLINKLTKLILEKSFAAARMVPRSLTLAVNLSPGQLLDFTVPALLETAAEQAGFPLSRLVIEITEGALVNDLARARAVALELKSLRCQLALDDFGTGYSSLKHLQALPFDRLKLDISFVSAMTQEQESRKLVAAIVGLGQSLGLTTVAEGVETKEQASMLIWHGCDEGQGWLYGRPAPAEEIPQTVMALRPASSEITQALFESDFMIGRERSPGQKLAQLQAIYDGIPAAVCFLDRNLRFISLNRQLAQINGQPIARHLGKTFAEMAPHLYLQIEPLIRRALEGFPAIGIEVYEPEDREATAPNEVGRTLLISCHPARDESDEVAGVFCAVIDITGHDTLKRAFVDHEPRSGSGPG
jgi:PAS domain S-box-containing protein